MRKLAVPMIVVGVIGAIINFPTFLFADLYQKLGFVSSEQRTSYTSWGIAWPEVFYFLIFIILLLVGLYLSRRKKKNA